jgi:Tol biopolymer transport system component
LYYTEPNASNDVYELNLDPATGRELSAPRRVNQGIGGTVAGSGVMSADGQSVAHTVGEGGFSGNTTLVVRSVQTGVERTLPLGSVKARNVWEWFPDNRSVIVDDQAAEGRMSWRRVDVATGASTLLFELPQRDRPSAAVTLTPDGSTVFVTIQPRAGLTILRRNLTTGEQSVVFNAPGEDTLWPIKALSPDGLQLAFGSHAKDAYIVRTVPVAGGSAREVYRSTQETNLLGWTRDGRHLLIAQTDPASHLQELMSLPSGGGPAVRVGLALGRFGGRVTTLDGSRLLVSGTTPQTELWAATNLLGGTRK